MDKEDTKYKCEIWKKGERLAVEFLTLWDIGRYEKRNFKIRVLDK